MVSKDKAYIVANEEQEREVLKKLEKDGFMWTDHANKPTELVTSIEVSKQFPYAIVIDRNISLKLSNYFEHYEIVYDGRKESKMKISKEVYDALVEWRDVINKSQFNNFVGRLAINKMDDVIYDWWSTGEIDDKEGNNRLIAIIRWVNGEDVFEVEKPKKWVVRSKETDSKGSHLYVFVSKDDALCYSCLGLANATHFATKEEAQSWANAHQEVVEVEE